MDIALNTDFNGSLGDPSPSLHHIAQSGFTHLHWCHQWNTDHLYADAEIAHIAGQLKTEGLKLLDIHGSDGSAGTFRWASTDETYRRLGVELVYNRLRLFAMLRGEGALMMHVPFYAVGQTEEQRAQVSRRIDAVCRSLDELVPACQALGMCIALENMAGDTFEALSDLFRRYPADIIGLCYDSGHGNIRDARGEFHGLDHLEEHLDRLMALHLNDNDGSGDQHMPPFYGTVDWTRLVGDIRRSAYPRMLSFELSLRNTPFKDNPAAFCADAHERCVRVATLTPGT